MNYALLGRRGCFHGLLKLLAEGVRLAEVAWSKIREECGVYECIIGVDDDVLRT